MIELSPAQAKDRIARLLAAAESGTLDFKRVGKEQGRMPNHSRRFTHNIVNDSSV